MAAMTPLMLGILWCVVVPLRCLLSMKLKDMSGRKTKEVIIEDGSFHCADGGSSTCHPIVRCKHGEFHWQWCLFFFSPPLTLYTCTWIKVKIIKMNRLVFFSCLVLCIPVCNTQNYQRFGKYTLLFIWDRGFLQFPPLHVSHVITCFGWSHVFLPD